MLMEMDENAPLTGMNPYLLDVHTHSPSGEATCVGQ